MHRARQPCVVGRERLVPGAQSRLGRLGVQDMLQSVPDAALIQIWLGCRQQSWSWSILSLKSDVSFKSASIA